jgi:hypothetical protein
MCEVDLHGLRLELGTYGVRTGSEKGNALYVEGRRMYILFKCFVTRSTGSNFVSRKWIIFNNEVAYERKIHRVNVVELRIEENICLTLEINERTN